MDYNYLEAMVEDVKAYIGENINILPKQYEDRDELEELLNSELWVEDSVTGNASGSYTFNAYKAEEYLCHNMDLLQEACQEFGCDVGESVDRGAKYCDVTIRCYLLGQAIDQALDEIWEGKED